MKDGSPMPRCKRPECVEQTKTFELTNKQPQDKSTGEVQVTERTTSRRNTKMFKRLSCTQLDETQNLEQAEQDKTEDAEAQYIDPVEQDKTEDAAMTPHFSQEQDKTEDAAMTPHFSQEQDKTEDAVDDSALQPRTRQDGR